VGTWLTREWQRGRTMVGCLGIKEAANHSLFIHGTEDGET
jgi:hypothetical protein